MLKISIRKNNVKSIMLILISRAPLHWRVFLALKYTNQPAPSFHILNRINLNASYLPLIEIVRYAVKAIIPELKRHAGKDTLSDYTLCLRLYGIISVLKQHADHKGLPSVKSIITEALNSPPILISQSFTTGYEHAFGLTFPITELLDREIIPGENFII